MIQARRVRITNGPSERRRAWSVAGLGLGGAVLAGTGARARGGVTEAEVRVFRWANELPDQAFPAIWVPMQYGTYGTVPALAVLALLRRRLTLAVGLAAGGTAAWALAKAVKPLVGRGRPAAMMEGVRRRGKEAGDLGFPSGHAAVSAGLTVIAWPYSGAGWRLAGATLAGFVPFARLYVGAHLPLDVAGGSALGLVLACAVDLALGSPAPRGA